MTKHKTLAFFIPHRGCPHQCSFCDQRTISGTVQAPTPEEVTQTCQAMLERSGPLESAEIAFFGGSFTAVEPAYQIALLEAAQPFLGEGMFSGIRISTRPDAVDSAVLERLERYHVTAVELGAQSMCDRVLYQNERGHDAQAVRQASAMLRERGFSLGLQQMVGLYGSTLQDEYDTLEQLLACQPETLRIYPTAVLEGTKLAEYYFRGGYPQLSQEEVLNYCADALCRCHHAGVRVIRLGLHDTPSLREHLLACLWRTGGIPSVSAAAERGGSRLWKTGTLCGNGSPYHEQGAGAARLQPEGTGGAGRFASCTGKCCRCCGNDSDGAAGL